MKEALYWTTEDKTKQTVKCGLCPHGCVIAESKSGICNARRNIKGKLISLTYNQLTSVNLDPIELLIQNRVHFTLTRLKKSRFTIFIREQRYFRLAPMDVTSNARSVRIGK